ncbi:TPM domain-containing protein [Sphingobacterium sp. LRF_L2]|uniref:TPM domain-containing protein n=1 Tax=Sphingobacterium sp. LRF_L2 TaxID=3369421 RepID=UPI003F61E195
MMRYKIKSLLSALFVCFLSILTLRGQDLPQNTNRLVSDFTGTLSNAEIKALESKISAFWDSTSTEIAVVMISTTDGYEIADYGVRLAKKWAIGNRKSNNGVLVLVALDDRTATIQTGYGLEGILPDIIAYRIVQNEIIPHFRKQDYFGGLDKAVDAIISYTKGEYKADKRGVAKGREGGGIPVIAIIIIVIIVISIISKNGGGGNRGGRVVTGRGSSDLFWWTLLNSLGRGGGGNRGGDGGFGGGFGGFGGGDFGGGGASGRW